MKLQAIVSAAAISAAMLFAGPVSAQSMMIGEEAIPVDQVDNFKEACEGLRAANAASLTTSEDQIDETETGSVTVDPSETTGSPDPAAQEKWDALLATLTIEQCETGGFFVE